MDRRLRVTERLLLVVALLFMAACASLSGGPGARDDGQADQTEAAPTPPTPPTLENCRYWRPGPIANPVTSLEIMEAIARSERHLPEGCGAALLAKAKATDFKTTRLYISYAIEAEQPSSVEERGELLILPSRPYCGGVRPRYTTRVIELPLRPEPFRIETQGDCGNEKRPTPRQ